LAEEVDKLSNLGRQVVIGIVLVGMLIGSAITTSVLASKETVTEFEEIMFRVAYYGYIFSMLISLLMVAKLVWNWIRGKPAV
jgi:hypothetical protein